MRSEFIQRTDPIKNIYFFKNYFLNVNFHVKKGGGIYEYPWNKNFNLVLRLNYQSNHRYRCIRNASEMIQAPVYLLHMFTVLHFTFSLNFVFLK